MKASILLAVAAAFFASELALSAARADEAPGKASEQAQAIAADDHAAKVQDIKKLIALDVDAEKMDKLMERDIERLMKGAPAGKSAEMDAFFTAFRLELSPDALAAKIEAAAIPLIDAKFSHEEIKELFAFQSSPSGRKLFDNATEEGSAKGPGAKSAPAPNAKKSDMLLAKLEKLDLPQEEKTKAREFLSSPLGLRAMNEIEPELSAKLSKICEQEGQAALMRAMASMRKQNAQSPK